MSSDGEKKVFSRICIFFEVVQAINFVVFTDSQTRPHLKTKASSDCNLPDNYTTLHTLPRLTNETPGISRSTANHTTSCTPSHSLSNAGDTCSPADFSPLTSHPRLTLTPACPMRYQDPHLFHNNKNSSLLSILSSKSIVKLNCVSCQKNMKYFVSGYIFKSPFLKNKIK